MSLAGKSGAAAAGLVAVFTLALFCAGCGDVYRPVATPISQPGGDPQREHHVLVVSSNDSNKGTAVAIDVSGDTAVAIFSGDNAVGRNPVHATNLGGTDYVVNRDDNSLSVFSLPVVPNSLNPPALVSLPGPTPATPGVTPAVPVFVVVAQNKVFVAESGRNKVAVVDPSSNSMTLEIQVGQNPVALVATPDGTLLYCLNKDENSVSVIFPANNTVLPTPIPVGTSPVWGAVSADGSHVFVVNHGSNSVSVIDTSSETVVNTLSVGAGPNYIVYDSAIKRAYITSPAGNSLSIINDNLGTVQTISMAGAPCNALSPISVTALADGTRAYVADQVTNNVCVLNTASNAFTRVISVGTGPTNTSGIISDPDSTRAHTASSATLPIASISRSSNVVTVNTSGSNSFRVGQTVVIAGVADTTYDGSFGITAVSSSTQFTYSQSGADSSSSSGGTATATVGYVSIIQTSNDTLVTQSDGMTPLTIPTLGTPTFITLTP